MDRIQEHLNVIGKVNSSNDNEFNPNMNGRHITCENGMHFDDNEAPNMSFSEKTFISHDNIFGTNLKSQEESMNDVYLTLLDKCVKSIDSKVIITQESHADVPVSLESSQVEQMQGKIHKALEIDKLLSTHTFFNARAHEVESPFIDPLHPNWWIIH